LALYFKYNIYYVGKHKGNGIHISGLGTVYAVEMVVFERCGCKYLCSYIFI